MYYTNIISYSLYPKSVAYIDTMVHALYMCDKNQEMYFTIPLLYSIELSLIFEVY